MKPTLTILLCIALFACKNKGTDHTFYGSWTTRFKSGSVAVARFKENGTHDYIVDGKLFSSGKSSFKNDTLKAFDPICTDKEEYYSTYKIDFLGGDSIRFVAIEDSCKPRIYDLDSTVFHRGERTK